jgi:hypothetical protein
MDNSKISQNLAQLIKHASTIQRMLTEIAKLDADRAKNLPSLQARIPKLNESVAAFSQAPEIAQMLNDWLASYRDELLTFQQEYSKRFGLELERELQAKGLDLAGHFPELRAGIFTIQINPDKWEVTLWYGPKQERLGTCAMSAKEVAEFIERSRTSLGSHVEEEVFVQRLQEALDHLRHQSDDDGATPIIAVLRELAMTMQNASFRRDPRREHYQSYGRADLSMDILRFNRRVQLRTATRALARSRDQFLWVPSDEHDWEGAIYSHIRLRKDAL